MASEVFNRRSTFGSSVNRGCLPPGVGIEEVRGIEFVPIRFEVADDLGYWRAEIPGKVMASAEALMDPMTPSGKRVQLLNPPGSEVGPSGTILTWGRATTDQVEAFGFRFG